MTRRKVQKKQGCVFPLFSLDSDDQLSLNFHRFVIFTGLLFYIYVVIHKVWTLDNTVYQKCPIALKALWDWESTVHTCTHNLHGIMNVIVEQLPLTYFCLKRYSFWEIMKIINFDLGKSNIWKWNHTCFLFAVFSSHDTLMTDWAKTFTSFWFIYVELYKVLIMQVFSPNTLGSLLKFYL